MSKAKRRTFPITTTMNSRENLLVHEDLSTMMMMMMTTKPPRRPAGVRVPHEEPLPPPRHAAVRVPHEELAIVTIPETTEESPLTAKGHP